MASIYIAAPFEDWRKAQEVRDRILTLGHSISYDWTLAAEEYDGREKATPELEQFHAAKDLQGVAHSTTVIVLSRETSGTGMWIEMGYAIAKGKRVIRVGPKRSIFDRLCICCETVDEALDMLDDPR